MHLNGISTGHLCFCLVMKCCRCRSVMFSMIVSVNIKTSAGPIRKLGSLVILCHNAIVPQHVSRCSLRKQHLAAFECNNDKTT